MPAQFPTTAPADAVRMSLLRGPIPSALARPARASAGRARPSAATEAALQAMLARSADDRPRGPELSAVGLDAMGMAALLRGESARVTGYPMDTTGRLQEERRLRCYGMLAQPPHKSATDAVELAPGVRLYTKQGLATHMRAALRTRDSFLLAIICPL